MEKIIQIAVDQENILIALTNEGRLLQLPQSGDWCEIPLPPLHTNELKEDERTNLSNK
jgi:hypothetical protein